MIKRRIRSKAGAVNLLQKNVISPEEEKKITHEGGNLHLPKLRLSSNEGHVNKS